MMRFAYKIATSLMLMALVAATGINTSQAASVVVVWSEIGQDTVASYSGTLDLSGYSTLNFAVDNTQVILDSNTSRFWGNIPQGPNRRQKTSASSGFVDSGLLTTAGLPDVAVLGVFDDEEQPFGFSTGIGVTVLYVEAAYQSGDQILGSALFENLQIGDIFNKSVFPSTKVFDDGVNQMFFKTAVAPVPSPAAFPLFATGLIVLGVLASRRRLSKKLNSIK